MRRESEEPNSEPWWPWGLCVTSWRRTSLVDCPGLWAEVMGKGDWRGDEGVECVCGTASVHQWLKYCLVPQSRRTLKGKLWENFTAARFEMIKKKKKKGLGEEFIHSLMTVYCRPATCQNLLWVLSVPQCLRSTHCVVRVALVSGERSQLIPTYRSR